VLIRKTASQNLFLSLGISFLLLALISLPGFAGPPNEITPLPTRTTTPTISINQQNGYATAIKNSIFPIQINSSDQQTPTVSTIFTFPLTDTNTPSPTNTTTPTITFTPEFTPTDTPTPNPTANAWLPILSNDHFIPTYTPTSTPLPPEKVIFCDTLGQPMFIPDNSDNGVSNSIHISDWRKLMNFSLYVDISHSWVGDLVIMLTNQQTGEKITILDRPGVPNSQSGCSSDNIITIFDDAAAQAAENKCSYSPAISGTYLPVEVLSTFSGMNISGTWTLNVSDNSPNDAGWVNHWCLQASVSEVMPAPTPTPTSVYLPPSAYIGGMSGDDQQLNLDCESRSAVDWAKHFGLNIGEIDFLNHLPNSDDPEAGFVGDPDGIWGHIPPDDYGVHAPPIAGTLRDYGAIAHSYQSLQWDDLRAEIASGKPVIVWIIGGSSYNLVNGIPHFYTAASTENTTIVAPWEHTVILVGYSPTSVTVLNGSKFIEVSLNQFLDSWSVLQFMGVLARP